ncbi:DNA-binding LacI/PurR family transcriptional regulator [Streptacidiphilus sp. MAP12-33]|uniref:substrate-binding domain-containing protein n=1 Tax=Streptacidiphilus sp. MAP12-33 TaxID=3156266 RepID=UPI003518FD3B
MADRVEERHERILRLVREHGSMRVTELAEQLGTSKETMRRDVVALVDVGRLRRVHGKVCWPTATLNARDARLARRDAAGSQGPLLGMVVPVTGYFFHGVVRGARAAATAAGARLLIGVTEYRREQDAAQLRTMAKAGVDGLLFTPSWDVGGPSPEDLAQLAGLDVPTVVVERDIPVGSSAALLDRVCSDHANGAAQAVRHLAGLGHGRVALLSRRSHTEPQVRAGYRAAVRALGLPDDDLGAPGEPGVLGHFDSFEEEFTRLVALARSGEVRAALVHADADAVNVQNRLAVEGLRVPEDFALVGYDDELPAVSDVALTAVAPAKHALGEAAVTLLLRRLADPSVERTHLALVPELKVRDSCGSALVGRGGQATSVDRMTE